MRLAGRGVLVRDDGVAGGVVGWKWGVLVFWGGRQGRRRRGRAGEGCGDDGEVVLVFVEVVRGGGVGAVEGVEEGRVEGTEGEFVDYVGEIEGCFLPHVISLGFVLCFCLGWDGLDGSSRSRVRCEG